MSKIFLPNLKDIYDHDPKFAQDETCHMIIGNVIQDGEGVKFSLGVFGEYMRKG